VRVEPEIVPQRKRSIQARIFLPSATEATPPVGQVVIAEVPEDPVELTPKAEEQSLQPVRTKRELHPLEAAARLVEKQVPSRLRGSQPPLRVSSLKQG